MKQQKYFNGKKPIYFTKAQVDKYITGSQRASCLLMMTILYDRFGFSQDDLLDVGEAYYEMLEDYNEGKYNARDLERQFIEKTGLEMLIG